MAVEQLTYDELVKLIAQFYNTDWENIQHELNKYNIPYGDIEGAYTYLKGTPWEAIYNSDGSIRSTSYKWVTTNEDALEVMGNDLNSNVQVLDKIETNIPVESTIDTAGKISFSGGLKAVSTGAKSALNFTMKEVVPAVAAASAGITVGKTIDKALYNINPDFWNEKGMSSLNPETWNSITSGDDSTGARLFNMVFGLNPDDGTSQAYMDENALAYLALYMQNNGIFEEGETAIISADYDTNIVKWDYTLPLKLYKTVQFTSRDTKYTIDKGYIIVLRYPNVDPVKGYIMYAVSNDKDAIVRATWTGGGATYKMTDSIIDGGHYYNYNFGAGMSSNFLPYASPQPNPFSGSELCYMVYHGNLGSIGGAPNGIGTQPDATTPDLSDVTDTAGALQKLKETYSDLWNNAVSQDVAQPDGTTKHYVYVPVGFPSTTGATDTQPTTGSQTQNNTKIDPKTDPQTLPEDLVKTLIRILTPTNTPNPPDTGGGDTPTIVPVTGSASSLYAIYNPTLSELNSFGAWLWSSDFIDQLKKLFSDPMQAIIGLHKIYANPITGGAQNIKVGYLDSGVSSAVVTNQYTTIDCGTVSLREYFGNVFDYAPYTQVQLYLPFIGIVDLDVADVMRASINIVYHVDVLTGACLAEVRVTRDSAGGTLYQYAGNAAVTLPISSGSYMGIVASIASIAGGVAGTLASGGAAAPMLIGAAGSALNARTRVEHSGGFSGNAGAMGGKIPYLIISRPQTELANNYSIYIGNPANKTVSLGSCSGYVQVKECHLENIPATREELNNIESLLKGGVLL